MPPRKIWKMEANWCGLEPFKKPINIVGDFHSHGEMTSLCGDNNYDLESDDRTSILKTKIDSAKKSMSQ